MQEGDQQTEGGFHQQADILGNPLIRVIRLAGGQAQQVMAALRRQPAAEDLFCHPLPPADSQFLPEIRAEHHHQNQPADQHDEKFDQLIQRRAVQLLQCIIKIPVPLVHADIEPDGGECQPERQQQ